MKTKDLALCSLLAVVLYIGQVGLAVLPNIEVVTLLIMVYSRVLKKKVYIVILVFTLLEGLTFGVGPWLLSYGYVWPLLALLASQLGKNDSTLFWACLSGFFGLFFGTLCSLPYFLTGGIALGMAYIIGGIPFDLVHCISNFFLALVLMKPVKKLLDNLTACY